MTCSGPALTAAGGIPLLPSAESSAVCGHLGPLGGVERVPTLGLTVYGCEEDEADLFREMGPQFGVLPTITEAAVSNANLDLALGHHCISIGHKTQVSASLLLAIRETGVRYISTRSAGFDHIDVKSAEGVGISVENVDYSPDGVADYTLMLIVMALRNVKSTIGRAQVHDYRLNNVRGKELRDMTVGVIGTGRIGVAVIERLQGFGCRVLAYDRCPKSPADYVPLDELLRRSDVVTLHTPLNADTHHLLNRQRIGQMRHGAFIVNTGRGALIDTKALLRALERGQLGGAALDVLEDEEGVFYVDHGQKAVLSQLLLQLQQLPNVLVTPHTAYYTDRALSDTVENTLINCLRFEGRAQWRS